MDEEYFTSRICRIKRLGHPWGKKETTNQGGLDTGKSGNLDVHFSRQGTHREFAKNIKNMILHREFNSQHRENFDVLQIKRYFRLVVGCSLQSLS